MKIAFVWPWERAKEIFPNWRDGHRAVIEELAKVHQVDWYIAEDSVTVKDGYDFYLFWDDGSSLIHHNLKGKKGLMLTSDNNLGRISPLDWHIIYCESQPIYEKARSLGYRAIKAMGTDTDFFKPTNKAEDIDFFYPATFSPWKRQRDIACLRQSLLCVGTIQPDGEEDLNECKKNHVQIEIGYFPAEKIRDYYNRAIEVIIPAIHGSERTVLEAMSMDLYPKVINSQNVKAKSYIEEFKKTSFDSPRDFVLKYYSHYEYAKNLLKGMEA